MAQTLQPTVLPFYPGKEAFREAKEGGTL